MEAPLLTTKLYIPQPRAGLVPRLQLVERLNKGLHCKLTLISAPAGFGKTTLLSEWLNDCSLPLRAAWLSLDEGDNDPARFLSYFIAALQNIENTIGQGITVTLRSPQPPSLDDILITLINQVNAIPHKETKTELPYLLVLDDYHLITTSSIHNGITFLIDNLPPQMHLVISSRADPPLPLARLRARGQLNELRLQDLRFTTEEATQFLNRVMGLDLSPDEVATLSARTEGWVAGLQMAAVSMQGRKDITAFLRGFTGGHRFILDYLVEEVLNRQPPAIQSFLLRTSILETLTGPLCETVAASEAETEGGEPSTSPASGQEILAYLERTNLFVVPLDDHRAWYRYHRLFADLLRKRLHQFYPDQVATLHHRASLWLEAHGLIAAAIDHTLKANDLERAADLIEHTAEKTLMRSEIATFLNWVEALPDTLVRTRPSLCVFHAWALLLSGRPISQVEEQLKNVSDETGQVSSQVAPLRAFIAAFKGQVPRAAALSRQALDELPEDNLFLRSIAAWNLAISYTFKHELTTAMQTLEDVVKMSQECGNIMVAVMALCNLAELHISLAQLHSAWETYQRALQLATDRHGHKLPVAGMALMGLGEIAREWNDLEVATRYLTEGIEQIGQWGEIGAIDGYISLARLKQAQGDVKEANAALAEAQQIALKFDATELDDFLVAIHQVRLWIAQGNFEEAARWIQTKVPSEASLKASDVDISTFRDHLRRYEHVTLARLFIVQGQPEKARVLLEPFFAILEPWGRSRAFIELQILLALVSQGQGNLEQALKTLERALSIAEPEGYIRTFVDEGAPMHTLLRQAASHGIKPAYIRSLLNAFHEPQGKPQPPRTQPLIEPLSEREIEVLQLLSKGHSNQEIAQKLFIAVSTARSHLKNIYRKLDVHKRWDAVQRAQELGLL